MNNRHRNEYIARLNRVIDYVDRHLTEDLSVEVLAGVASFSPYHFHRLFSAMTGETLGDCVRRRRLEAAANDLVFHPQRSILDIALDNGIASAEAFSRAFRKYFDCTPTAWRRGRWHDWSAQRMEQLRKIHQDGAEHNDGSYVAIQGWPRHSSDYDGAGMPVTVASLPERRVIYLRYIGPYGPGGVRRTWDRLFDWCAAAGLSALSCIRLGIAYDSPGVTEPAKCRYDACVVADDVIAEGEFGVQTVPGGRYALYDFVGNEHTIIDGWSRLFGGWLPASGYTFDDRPVFELYEPTRNAGLRCKLCLPVQPL